MLIFLNLPIELKPSLAPLVPRCLSFCDPDILENTKIQYMTEFKHKCKHCSYKPIVQESLAKHQKVVDVGA